MTNDRGYRLGVDVGGTFTDLVLAAPDGHALTRKVLSTTANYAGAIIEGAAALLAEAGAAPAVVAEVVHGTTVATNAILGRRGARTGLLTTAGFRDLLEIGRLRLSRLYDLDFERPAPLVPRRWRLRGGRAHEPCRRRHRAARRGERGACHLLAGPGGWGNPLDRDPDLVLKDVLEEKLTPEYVRREYGVVIDADAREVLPEETALCRAEMRSRPLM